MNQKRKLALGLDVSTQSITAVALDIDSGAIIAEHSIDYLADERLNRFGIRQEDYILPPFSEGEANQPAVMFFAVLDAMFHDLSESVDLNEIAVVNTSGQQHGHVYLNRNAPGLFQQLCDDTGMDSDLVTVLKDSLAWGEAPIWMTSNTGEEADFIRDHLGGMQAAIELSGADVPLRFTGVVIRHTGRSYPQAYRTTAMIQLISSLIPAVLTGNALVPADFGNGSGMSLMDYRKKDWSPELLSAVSDGLEGGAEGLRKRLPDIVSPETIVGTIASYFVRKYGFSSKCRIVAGSGDNPQSKVLVTGDLLSLGTSIVNMVSTDGDTVDLNGYASAMYDGIGRPFMFGTRTNGVLLWDRMRATYGMEKKAYIPGEDALRNCAVGENILFWQARNESFPPSPAIDITRVGGFSPDFTLDYPALIETTLGTVYRYSTGFTRNTDEPLSVTGGARSSREILRRVAAIWNRPVVPIEAGGAALGAAAAGAYGYCKLEGNPIDISVYTEKLLKKEKPIVPLADDVSAIHGEGGFLERLAEAEKKVFG